MTFTELVKKSLPYRVALSFDHMLPRRVRRALMLFFLFVAIATFASSFIEFESNSFPLVLDGIFFLSLALFLILVLLESFYSSSRYRDTGVKFSLAEVLSVTDDLDITTGFLNSNIGLRIRARLGIAGGDLIAEDRPRIVGSNFEMEVEGDYSDLVEYAKSLYLSDKSLSTALSSHSVNLSDFLGASAFVEKEDEKRMEKERWWSRGNLESIPSLGSSLSYGQIFELSKYARHLSDTVPFSSLDLESGYRQKEINQLENTLARGAEANAVLVDNDEGVAKDIIARLAKKINIGTSLSSLEHKMVLELYWTELLTAEKTKADFEGTFIKILKECAGAGNVILYIPNLPTFIAEAAKIGVNLPALLEEYLASAAVHIIAQATKTDFYYFLEMNPGLGRRFERVIPDDKGVDSAMPAIIEKVIEIEGLQRGKILFTYQALAEIADLSDRFITVGEMPTKAIDLLIEITPWAIREGIRVLGRNDVDIFISAKTGIAAGEISSEEGQKLSKLEELLHLRIVGQEEAVAAVSSAMRRSRAGINNPKRPIASFLFLGPTGVGKTETAKALAESYFGNEEKINRLDMSEYSDADAIPRLLGSMVEGKTGNLASKLRESPYGVLLLDEFEKAAPDVLNLFLRVLDEGKFTDALGGEVSARSSIIIATSNAASEMIWKIIREGGDLDKQKDLIIDYLVDSHIFKPELVNRFDVVVIFKPLQDKELRSVADNMVKKLVDRVREEKQIELKPSSELLDYLVLHGADREFGARSINRIMQSKIEDALAKRIISGSARAGSTVELGVRDIL